MVSQSVNMAILYKAPSDYCHFFTDNVFVGVRLGKSFFFKGIKIGQRSFFALNHIIIYLLISLTEFLSTSLLLILISVLSLSTAEGSSIISIILSAAL